MKFVSAVAEEFFSGQLNIAQDGAQEAGTESLASMYRNRRGPAVRMTQKKMVAAAADNLKTYLLEDADQFLSLETGKASHTEIC